MGAIWDKYAERPTLAQLEGDIKTDVLVIGGGLAGILCGYMLKNKGIDYAVVEADKICSSTTGNTTAKITFQHGLIYDKLIEKYGIEFARLYLKSQQEALENYRKLSEKIPCDFKESASFVYSVSNREKLEKEALAYEKLGCKAEFTEALQLPFKAVGAVCVENQAQFNPLKFLYALSENLKIYENTKVTQFKPGYVVTNRGKIYAKKIIVATHFPLLNKHGGYFIKMYQHRSYVLALRGAEDLNGMYVDEDKKGLSFRSYNGSMIIGGGSHRTGKKGGGFEELLNFKKLYYPQAEEICRWATQDCMTLDDIAYIGQYSKATPDIYVATGFNKWGFTSAMAAANILTDLVSGKENEYYEVFTPSRSILHPQLAVNTLESLAGIIRPSSPRCPHMGCALKYNPQEHTWDCPCHGSRFEENGELINNPANANLKKSPERKKGNNNTEKNCL